MLKISKQHRFSGLNGKFLDGIGRKDNIETN
jgi:hypothetical protein